MVNVYSRYRLLVQEQFRFQLVFSHFIYERGSAASNPVLTDLSHDSTTSIFSDFQRRRKLSYSKVGFIFSRRLLKRGRFKYLRKYRDQNIRKADFSHFFFFIKFKVIIIPGRKFSIGLQKVWFVKVIKGYVSTCIMEA